MLDFVKLKSVIEKNNSFVLTTHVNPDADAIGSEIAFSILLKKLGKEVLIVNHSKIPYYLEFLDPQKIIRKYDASRDDHEINKADAIIFLDLNQLDRVRSLQTILGQSDKTKVCIDHHQNPKDFINYSFIDTDYSATGHIIYDFIKQTGILELDLELALPLYAAIMTDTGSFRFERTTADVHRIAAELLGLGVNPTEIYDKIYDRNRSSKLILLGEAISSIQLDDTKQIAYMTITQETLTNSGAEESEVDGFVNYCLSIENVQIGLLFFELKNGVKVSFRSKGEIPVSQLAEQFKGGGHRNAAGARLFDVNLDTITKEVLSEAKNYLPKK